MITAVRPSRWASSLCCLLCLTASAAKALDGERSNSGSVDDDDVVVLSLRPTLIVGERELYVADVAALEGGDEQLRYQIARLDLSDPPRAGQTLRIRRDQIAYRLQIAGIEPRLFQIRGASVVAVTLASYEVPEGEIFAAAQRALLARLPWSPNDVAIRLTQPIRGPFRVPGLKDDVHLETDLRSARTLLGKVRLDVAISVHGKRQWEVPVHLDVQLYQTVAVSTRRIERGQTLTEDDVHFDRRSVDSQTGYLLASDSPIGKRAKRTILSTQVIGAADVEPASLDNPVVVKQRDVVKLVAQKNGLSVTASGEALQDGRVGQVIRVRNADSKNIVVGRVANRSVVEVPF